jgi:hypothetical protein
MTILYHNGQKKKRTKGETPIHKINNVDMYAYQNVVVAYFWLNSTEELLELPSPVQGE